MFMDNILIYLDYLKLQDGQALIKNSYSLEIMLTEENKVSKQFV